MEDFADLMRDVKKIVENKNLFYSYRLSSVLSMQQFYELFKEQEELRGEIVDFLVGIAKKEVRNLVNASLDVLILIYRDPTTSQPNKEKIVGIAKELENNKDREIKNTSVKFLENL